MPERKIIAAWTQKDYDRLVELLGDGWILDPNIYKATPMRIDYGIVYHLIKFSEDELAARAREIELEPQILSMVKVPYAEVDALLEQGYTVKDSYAKDVVLVKIGSKESGER